MDFETVASLKLVAFLDLAPSEEKGNSDKKEKKKKKESKTEERNPQV